MEKRKNPPYRINNSSLPKIAEVRALLERKYPNCFVASGTEPKPLKTGVSQEIYNALKESYPDIISRPALESCLAIYTASAEYNKCLLQDGAKRIDLDGNEIEPVSAEHQEAARNNPRKVKFITKKPQPISPKRSDDKQAALTKPLQAELQKIKIQDNDTDSKPQRKTLSLKKKTE